MKFPSGARMKSSIATLVMTPSRRLWRLGCRVPYVDGHTQWAALSPIPEHLCLSNEDLARGGRHFLMRRLDQLVEECVVADRPKTSDLLGDPPFSLRLYLSALFRHHASVTRPPSVDRFPLRLKPYWVARACPHRSRSSRARSAGRYGLEQTHCLDEGSQVRRPVGSRDVGGR